ncbi:MAG TPA: DUF2914 domain-containing protein [Rhizomicrobium sp.]
MSERIEPEFIDPALPIENAVAEERVDAAREATGYKIKNGALALRKTVFGWISRHEGSLSAVSMIGGFAIDNVAYRRIDLPNTQALFIGYLTVSGLCIILLHMLATRARAGKPMPKWHSALPMATQFTLGALWSGFLIFYSRGAVLTESWPFMLVLVAIFIGNEVFKKYHSQLVFTSILYAFALFSYFIVTVPIFTHTVGPFTFLISGLLAFSVFLIFLRVVRWAGQEQWRSARLQVMGGAFLVYATLTAFYFTGTLPPLPLALADKGVFHFVKRVGDVYQAEGEPQGWLTRFGKPPVLHIAPGQPVYVYSAVFAPIKLSTTIIHRWQHYNRLRSKWQTISTVSFTINGGRDGGYRNYTIQHKVWDGDWRVDVKNADGRIIGRIPFHIETVPQPVTSIPVTLK